MADVEIETGVAYDALHGWRVYQETLGMVRYLTASQARKLAKMTLRFHVETPADHEILAVLAADLRYCATECARYNKSGKIPDGYLEAIPTMGTA